MKQAQVLAQLVGWLVDVYVLLEYRWAAVNGGS